MLGKRPCIVVPKEGDGGGAGLALAIVLILSARVVGYRYALHRYEPKTHIVNILSTRFKNAQGDWRTAGDGEESGIQRVTILTGMGKKTKNY